MMRVRGIVTGMACALAMTAGGGAATAQAARVQSHVVPAEPIVVIVLENKTYQNIVGSTSAPYIQSLISAGKLFTNYQAAPGSLPDYLRMTGGIATTSAAKNSENIFDQLQKAGIGWGQYNESMPSACYTRSGPLPYDKNHNAAVWYQDITSNKTACANMLPYTSFDPAHLRAFSYVVPNDSNDMHDGANKAAQIKAGDNWLKANVPAMLSNGAQVIVTWDEGTRSNEHIATIAIGAGVTAGTTDATAYTHFGLLAGLEDAFGVARVNSAVGARPFPIG
jgi:phosphatidylinositol-3-phosphatase